MKHRELATQIVKTLVTAGYTAYFAGGWVRDFIMKHPSDDIDIATDAPPEIIKELFPHTILVGQAFGVVIVVMDGHQFEVATFRKDLEYSGGRRPDKIVLSTPMEDALRRDFTINGLFYDPLTEEIHDYVGGLDDIKRGIIRTIGNPNERFSEDRLRMIRAIRFAARFGFPIDPETKKAISEHAHTLFPAVAMERIWQEFHKMAKFPKFDQAVLEMHRLGLLPVIFPSLQDLDTDVLNERVTFFKHIPKGTPVILYLMELFPDLSLDQLLEVCQYLRTSGHEGKIVEFAYRSKKLFEQEETSLDAKENINWAYFYAHRFFNVCFDFLAARYPEEKKAQLIERHGIRRERLLPHIQRIIEKKPVVNAATLQDYGVLPGKEMGILLKEAENIAIERDLHDPSLIIAILKEHSAWPEK